MIASRLGLAITAAVACVLAIVLALDLRRDAAPTDRAIVSEFSADAVLRLAWRDHAIARDPKSPTGWSWVEPPGTADAHTVEDLLATLRGARWHRREGASAAGKISDELSIETAAGTTRIGIGQVVEGSEQQWIAVDDHALLVDGWVARSLAPDKLALRMRTPLAAAAQATEIRIEPGVTLRGTPRRLVEQTGKPLELVVSPELAENLERALVAVVVTALPTSPVAASGMRISLDGKLAVADAGTCLQANADVLTLVHAIVGPDGSGCVDANAWRELQAAARALDAPAEQIVERRPFPVEPAQIALADNAVIDVTKRPRVGDRDADPARIVELLAVLASPGEPAPLPATKPIGKLQLTGRSGFATTLDLYAGNLVARRGEPIAVRVGQGAFAILVRPGSAYRDPTLWTEEPTSISSIAIDGATYTRGRVLGEWTRTGSGRDDPPTLDKLAVALASPRSLGPRKTAEGKRRTITISVTPPTGAASNHTLVLVLGPECGAMMAGSAIVVPGELCQLVERLTP